ncbi:MAG: hypothetical protein IJU61_00220 [Victivallales bacterium]|nr:hypothetical protein [Victivallales bacterium]
MWNGTQLFKYLQGKTKEELEKIYFCCYGWSPESVDEWLQFHPNAFGEKWQRDIIEGMSEKDKQQVIRDACHSYFNSDELEESREINNEIELKLTEYVNAHKKTHYTVRLSFLPHCTVEVDAENATDAARQALNMVESGKVTKENFCDDGERLYDTVEVDEVYNTETCQAEADIWSHENKPAQKKDFEPKQEA